MRNSRYTRSILQGLEFLIANRMEWNWFLLWCFENTLFASLKRRFSATIGYLPASADHLMNLFNFSKSLPQYLSHSADIYCAIQIMLVFYISDSGNSTTRSGRWDLYLKIDCITKRDRIRNRRNRINVPPIADSKIIGKGNGTMKLE